MAPPLLIDTDVVIDYLRDYPAAVSYVEAHQERFLISVVTVAELMLVCAKARNEYGWSGSSRRLKLSHSTCV
jgi:predicted nucleic acid-binding protein